MRSPKLLPWVCGTLALAVLAGCGTSLPGTAGRKAANAPRSQAAEAWQALPDAPTARFDGAGVPIGFTLHVLGGYDDNLGRLASAERFQAFDKWSTGAALPTARAGLSVTELPAQRIFAVGGLAGSQPLARAELYSTANGTWERLPDMPTARAHAGIAGVGVFAFVAGGGTPRPSGAFEVFDVRDRSWKKLPDLPTPREGCVAAKIGQRVAVVGGRTATGTTGVLELYDFDKGEWKRGAAMPTPRAHAAWAIYGHHLFVLGGKLDGGVTDAVESYDLVTDKWSRHTPLPVALHGAIAAKLGARLVVTGGMVGGKASAKTWMTTFPF